MEPTFEELRSMLGDQESELTLILKKEGYKMRVPRAEWHVFRNALIIIDEKGTSEIPNSELERILNKSETVPDGTRRLIDEWYAISLYRYGHEREELKNKRRVAAGNNDKTAVGEYDRRIEELSAEVSQLLEKDFRREHRKRQLGYYYKEDGDRLEKLYQILWGKHELIDLKFGDIQVSVSPDSHNSQMDKDAYEISRGFFNDLSNAYNFVKGLRGPTNISISAGIVYSDESAYGKGKGNLEIGGRNMTLEAVIEKEGIKNTLSCGIKASELGLSSEKILKNTVLLKILLPDYEFGTVENVKNALLAENTKGSVRFAYFGRTPHFGDELSFGGEPEMFEAEVPKVLEAIFKTNQTI